MKKAGNLLAPTAFLFIACAAVFLHAGENPEGEPLLDGPSAVLDCPNGEIDVFQSGSQLFSDRPYPIVEVPATLDGASFVRGRIDRAHVSCLQSGVVCVATPVPKNNPANCVETLVELGFQKVDIPEFQLFSGNQNRSIVYQKQVEAGEVLTLGKWGVFILPGKKESAPPGETIPKTSQIVPVKEISTATPGKTVYVLLFGGQSNALGWGYQQYLEDTGDPLAKPQADVEMFFDIPGEGMLPENTLLPLQSGNSNTNVKPLPNCHPSLTVAPISRFGPELSFARTVRDHVPDPEDKLVVIKFAMGGSSLWKADCWLPDGTSSAVADGKLYRIFQEVAKRGVAALRRKYPDYKMVILGMGWVQGESDALEGRGEDYQKNLALFISDVRATFGENLPFVLAKISPQQIEGNSDPKKVEQWEIVRKAQDAVAASTPNVLATETSGTAYPVAKGLSEGQYHYTTPALLRIGQDMGNALVAICGWTGNSTPSSASPGS